MSDINLKIISAGAGSGKTFRLTEEMYDHIIDDVRISGIIATTFTSKAAAELQERVRAKLLEKEKFKEANELSNALIGTVHGIGVKLLRRFAFEAGLSHEVDIISDEDQQIMFNNALATVLKPKILEKMEKLVTKLGLNKRTKDYDWRKNVREVTEIARGNDFDEVVLNKSKKLSFETFQRYLGEKSKRKSEDVLPILKATIEDAINAIKEGKDETKTTSDVVTELKSIVNDIARGEELPWFTWVKMTKLKPGAKSKIHIEPIAEIATQHTTFFDFHQDIQDFIHTIFDISSKAIEEYQSYKRIRGLIDYTDMEILVKKLLEQESVQEVLKDELDLLMVDEFQDTNPIQLAIFFKLSQIAKHAVWVGDPKQSIYGFRGADPKLMKAIMKAQGGVHTDNILEHSYRSRKDIVGATNGIFKGVFPDMTQEEITLTPKRDENEKFGTALKHWHFQPSGDSKKSNQSWFDLCIAEELKAYLAKKEYIETKGSKIIRQIVPSDVAILCRTNDQCETIAKALHQVGIKSAIARKGLLLTAESRLILACLKFVLDSSDTLSVAEILVLVARIKTNEIIEDRLNYLTEFEKDRYDNPWAKDNEYIQKLRKLKSDAAEFSSSEMLNFLLDELDLRRIIMSWGNAPQRLDNIDVLRKLALDYENACNRLNSAASLGGFILWLSDMEFAEKDQQAFGEDIDAVNIVTYHRSKGLEWPVVICHALETDLKENVFGLSVISEKEEVDFDDLLGHRWLRFWVNPYSDQSKGTALEDALTESDEKRIVQQNALAEEIRLLYVGITRARDYLIFPSRKSTPMRWLNRVFHKGKSDVPALDPENPITEWSWKETFIPIESKICSYEDEFEHNEIEVSKFDFFEERSGKVERKPYYIDLEAENFMDFAQVKNNFHHYASSLEIEEDTNENTLVEVLKTYLLSHHEDFSGLEKKELLKKIAKRMAHEQDDFSPLLKQYDAFFSFLKKTYDFEKIEKKTALKLEKNGRCIQTQLDFFAEKNNTIFVLQHDFYNIDKSKQKQNEQNNWAFWVQKSLQTIHPNKEIIVLIHSALLGTIRECRFF
jgi:ATP-dependent helicase/nuclease subunit A